VNENVGAAAVGLNEPKALRRVKPLYRARSHVEVLLRSAQTLHSSKRNSSPTDGSFSAHADKHGRRTAAK
jgi:hypothetical protein